MRSTFISALAAASLLVSTTAAAAQQPGAPAARSGAEVGDASEDLGLFGLIGLIVVLLIIGGVIILDDDDEPDSP